MSETKTVETEELVLKLQQERDQYKTDIETTVGYISRLLSDMGLLTPDMKFQFSMGTLTRNVLPLLSNPSKAEKRFGYMAELGDIIVKYAPQKPANEPNK